MTVRGSQTAALEHLRVLRVIQRAYQRERRTACEGAIVDGSERTLARSNNLQR